MIGGEKGADITKYLKYSSLRSPDSDASAEMLRENEKAVIAKRKRLTVSLTEITKDSLRTETKANHKQTTQSNRRVTGREDVP